MPSTQGGGPTTNESPVQAPVTHESTDACAAGGGPVDGGGAASSGCTYDPTPVDDTTGGGPQSPVQSPVDTATPPDPTPCCGDGTAVAGASGNGTDGSSAQASTDAPPDPTPVPGAVDATTGQPLDGSAPAPSGTDPKTGLPAGTDPKTGQPIDPSSGQGVTPSGQPTVPTAGAPASTLPDWPTWQQEFAALGVDQSNIDRIGSQNLTDQQLALVYITIRREMQQAGVQPGAGTTGTGTGQGTGAGKSAWSDQWAKKFAALGLSQDQLAQIQQLAIQNGADDAALQQLYDQLAAQSGQGTGNGQGQSQQPGWSDQWAQKFKALGMPDQLVQAYAQSGAPASGLEAAYNYASKRLDDFKATGYYDKLKGEGITDDQLWQLVLSDKPLGEKDLEGIYSTLHKQNMPMWQKALQTGISFFPGGELLQYVVGHKFISGEQIDRTDPLQIALAGLSGLAAFTSIRGAIGVFKGWKAAGAIAEGSSAIQKTAITMNELGLTKEGAALTDAAQGAASQMGRFSKLTSLIPFTAAHQRMVGLGQLESAAQAFNAGGAEKLLAAGPDGLLQVSTLGRTFEDAMRGNLTLLGPKNAYLGNISLPFKSLKTAPIVADPSGTVFTANKALSAGRGDQVLTALLEAAGPTRLDTSVLGAAANDIAKVQYDTIGQLMGADAAKVLGADKASGLGAILGRLKPGVTEYYSNLARNVGKPGWYDKLVEGTIAKVLTGGAAVDEAGGLVDAAGNVVAAGGGTAAGAVADVASGGGAAVLGDVTAAAPIGGTADVVTGAGTAATGTLPAPLLDASRATGNPFPGSDVTRDALSGFHQQTASGIILPEARHVRDAAHGGAPLMSDAQIQQLMGKPVGMLPQRLVDSLRTGLPVESYSHGASGLVNADEVIVASGTLPGAA